MSDLLTGNRQYCLDKAADCERKAAQARHPDAAKEFQSIAARWRVAAATRDFNQKVEDILRTLRVGRIIMMGWYEAPRPSNLALLQALRGRAAMPRRQSAIVQLFTSRFAAREQHPNHIRPEAMP